MKKKIIIIVVILIILIVSVYLTNKHSLSQKLKTTREYTYALIDKGLYLQAATEYKKLLETGKYNDKERANIAYLMGNIYMENAHNYEEALASYTLVNVLSPKNELTDEVNRKSVECLERLGRSADAKREMEKSTLLNKPTPLPKGLIVAKIGKRNITIEELEKQINSLPPYIQENYKEPAKRIEFLKQYIATELLYDSAKRKNFENDSEIVEKSFQIKKSLMVQKLLSEELKGKIDIRESEIKLYYDAHKKDFLDKTKKQKPLEETSNEIQSILQREKEQEASSELLNKLMRAEQVQIFYNAFNITK